MFSRLRAGAVSAAKAVTRKRAVSSTTMLGGRSQEQTYAKKIHMQKNICTTKKYDGICINDYKCMDIVTNKLKRLVWDVKFIPQKDEHKLPKSHFLIDLDGFNWSKGVPL